MSRRLALVCGVASVLSTAPAGADSHPMVTVPGGVVDAAGSVAYLHSARGGVDAVELSNGHLVWSDATPQRPVAGADGRLLVELIAADGVRLRVLEAKAHGRVWVTSERLPLPQWAIGGPSHGTFSAIAELVGSDTVRYRWSARKRWSQGMHPPRSRQGDEAIAELQEASGDVLVDLARATVVVSSAGASPSSSMPYQTDHGTMRVAWWVDGVWCSLATETADGASYWIVRRTRDDGRSLPPLKGRRATTITPRLSSDGHLLVMPTANTGPAQSLRLPSGGDGPALSPGTLPREFALAGALLLVAVDAQQSADSGLSRRELRAITLDGERVKWVHPLYAPPVQSPPQ
jgi:hypothetical protein